MTLDIFTLLCGMAVAAFAATARASSAWGWWLGGLLFAAAIINPSVLALPWAPMLGFDAGEFAMLILLVSCWIINDFRKAAVPLFMSGILTVAWASALALQGLSVTAGIAVCAATAMFCIGLSLHSPRFSTRRLEDEANILVFALALALVVLPSAMAGWESAMGLQDRGNGDTVYRENMPVVLFISCLFVILGGYFARRKYK